MYKSKGITPVAVSLSGNSQAEKGCNLSNPTCALPLKANLKNTNYIKLYSE